MTDNAAILERLAKLEERAAKSNDFMHQLREDLGELRKDLKETNDRIDELHKELMKRIPVGVTVAIGVMTSVIGFLLGMLK